LADRTDRGRSGLDPHWVKLPIGGAGKLSTFATLLGANKLNVAVVVDSSTKDAGAIKRLRDNDQLNRRALVEIRVHRHPGRRHRRPLRAGLLPRPGQPGLRGRPADADHPGGPQPARPPHRPADRGLLPRPQHRGGKVNHYRPAAELLRQQAALIPQLSPGTLAKAELLFKRLNELIK
jgi:hypothetical protein